MNKRIDVSNIKNKFDCFEYDDELLEAYSSQYYQFYDEEIVEYFDYSKSVQDIFIELQEWLDDSTILDERKNIIEVMKSNYISNVYPSLITMQEFEKLLLSEECYYCGTNKKEFESLYEKSLIKTKRNRGYDFEIDRKHPNKEYSIDNIVMSCYWCNNAKTDEFFVDKTEDEFSEIGRAIGNVFKKRLTNG